MELQRLLAELDFSQQVSTPLGRLRSPFATRPSFSQLIFPFSVSLRISMAWRWWAEGSLSRLLRWKTTQYLTGARKVPLKTRCPCELAWALGGEVGKCGFPRHPQCKGQTPPSEIQVPPSQPLSGPLPTPMPAFLRPSAPFQEPAPNGDFPAIPLLVNAVHAEWP